MKKPIAPVNPYTKDDSFGSFRGIILGVAIGIVFWVILILALNIFGAV